MFTHTFHDERDQNASFRVLRLTRGSLQALNQSSRSMPRSFTFTDFAGEIRNKIYRECLLIDRWTLATNPSSWGLSPNILRLNHQIYNEASTVLWSENDWVHMEGDDFVMSTLEARQLASRQTPQNPLSFGLVVYPVLKLKIDWALENPDTDPRAFAPLRPARLIHVFELPALCRAVMDLRHNPPIKAHAFIDNRKPKAPHLLNQLVNWTLPNTAEYDRTLGHRVLHPRTRIRLAGASNEVIHPDQGERLDLPWYHPENTRAAVRMWQHRLREAKGDRWQQRCIHLDYYELIAKATSLPWFVHQYGPRERLQWQRHVLSLGHYVARASLGLKDPKHATDFLANIWRWNALELDGKSDLKNDMAETNYLMSEGLRMQGQHTASLVHLVQALMLWNDHAEATEAATELLRDHSAVGPEEHDCFVHNLRNILDPVMWGLPIERSLPLRNGNQTLPFMNFRFPKGWRIHWDWDREMQVSEN